MCTGVLYCIVTVLMLIGLHALCEIAQKAESKRDNEAE